MTNSSGGLTMVDLKDIRAHFNMCGWKEVSKNKWAPIDAQTMNGTLPNTHAQYIDYESKYQYSSVKKIR